MSMVKSRTLFWSQLLYDGAPLPYAIGATCDNSVAALLKRILLEEAKEKLAAVEGADDVLTEIFRGKLEALDKSLECIIPCEIETVLLLELRNRLDTLITAAGEDANA